MIQSLKNNTIYASGIAGVILLTGELGLHPVYRVMVGGLVAFFFHKWLWSSRGDRHSMAMYPFVYCLAVSLMPYVVSVIALSLFRRAGAHSLRIFDYPKKLNRDDWSALVGAIDYTLLERSATPASSLAKVFATGIYWGDWVWFGAIALYFIVNDKLQHPMNFLLLLALCGFPLSSIAGSRKMRLTIWCASLVLTSVLLIALRKEFV
jgi:hypothetical protein